MRWSKSVLVAVEAEIMRRECIGPPRCPTACGNNPRGDGALGTPGRRGATRRLAPVSDGWFKLAPPPKNSDRNPPMRSFRFLADVPRRLRQAEHDGADAIAMQQLAALPGPFLPWTSYTMRPTTIVAILSDIAIN